MIIALGIIGAAAWLGIAAWGVQADRNRRLHRAVEAWRAAHPPIRWEKFDEVLDAIRAYGRALEALAVPVRRAQHAIAELARAWQNENTIHNHERSE